LDGKQVKTITKKVLGQFERGADQPDCSGEWHPKPAPFHSSHSLCDEFSIPSVCQCQFLRLWTSDRWRFAKLLEYIDIQK
jgi:hypothetical protein